MTSKIVFSLNCYEKDYKKVADEYEYRIALNNYKFDKHWIIILNVSDIEKVKKLFKRKADKIIVADTIADKALSYFGLNRDSFKDEYADGYKYSIASIIELYLAKNFDYICHFTSDVSLYKKGDWISKGLPKIIGNCIGVRPGYPRYKLQKPSEKEVIKTQIFSDHAYLIPVSYFRQPSFFKTNIPLVKGIHPDYGGASFERRITSHMINYNKYLSVVNSVEIIHPV